MSDTDLSRGLEELGFERLQPRRAGDLLAVEVGQVEEVEPVEVPANTPVETINQVSDF